jgi:hypothetical protein
MHGIASDDIDRLQKKAEMLRLKLGARQGFFLGWGSAGIKKELAETEALIADFRQRQGARDAQAARDAMAMISDPGAGGGRPRKKTKAEGEGTGGKTKSGTEWPVDTLQVYQADQLREAFEKIGKINDEWQPVSYVDSANLHEAEMLRKAFEEIGELNKDVAASVKDAGKVGAEVGQDLALVFSSAAGAAITNWQGVGSLLKGILQDLAQIALREAVTKPLTGMLTTALTSFLPKFDVGTDYVPRDMAAIVHKGERIVPAAQNLRDRSAGGGRSGGIVLNSAPSIRIDARTDVGAVAQMVAQGMRVANEQMLMELKSAGVMG